MKTFFCHGQRQLSHVTMHDVTAPFIEATVISKISRFF
jgi:hypothetical protein